MNEVKISVRRLVEFILRSGDIDSTVGALRDAEAMREGTNIHKKIQKEGGTAYQAEVYLKLSVPVSETLTITLEGRADGVIEDYHPDPDSALGAYSYTIDEIKGTYSDLRYIEEPIDVHLAQACCYAYMYAREKALMEIDVQLTYASLETGAIKRFSEHREFAELEVWFMDVIRRYGVWAQWALDWKLVRCLSIGECPFPFDYRPGQKNLISGVYNTIIRGKRLFIQAPTGTGKTISTIYPAIKAMGEGMSDKIFYLTAKTITRTVAEETYQLLFKAGLKFKAITLTAKEKICIFDEIHCNPRECPRAKGHFDRVNDAVFDMIGQEFRFTRENIEAYADKHQVCPFEFQLDVALWVDSVICDYNYVFDPHVYLKRFFNEVRENYIFLIDEAHNLVDRAREMYSAALFKSQFLEVKRAVKPFHPKLALKIEKCNKYLLDLRNECENCGELTKAGELTIYLMQMITEMELFLKEDHPTDVKEDVLALYLEARHFINTCDAMDERYISYMEHTGNKDFMVRLFCVDPSKDLCAKLDLGLAAVFFSATLLPVQYYKELLSTSAAEDYDMYAQSPFESRHRLLAAAGDVSSRYTRRNAAEYEKIADYIYDIVRSRNGNYMVFFPSYAYMQSVYEIFAQKRLQTAGHGLELLIQENSMSEEARQQFLEAFQGDMQKTMIGFCVLGGIFSEGIDLKEDRLIGVIIVGTGLPQPANERELLRTYYDGRHGRGFDYAYLYPGMNKVLQAGGRVIRTEKDRGVIVLLDERFNYAQYRNLFPREWDGLVKVTRASIGNQLDHFWEENLK